MEKENVLRITEPYPTTSYQKHKKQRFWQILFPIMLCILLVLALAVFVVLTASQDGGGGDSSLWADTSMIWLLLPLLVFAVLMFVLFSVLVFLVARVLHILPAYSSQVQYYVDLVSSKVKYWTEKSVQPIIKVRSINASITAVLASLSGRSHK